MNMPEVSVIMPAYNAELYIREAITSVVVQTYKNWELIIIDDGSTDSTAKIVAEWLLKDDRVHYFYQDNGKQGKARNLGISKSKGKYLAFLDADDLWLPKKLEIQLYEIQDKNVDLVFSDSYIFSDYEIDNVSQKVNVPSEVYYDKKSIGLFLKSNRIPILTVLVKKEKVLNVNCFSEKIDIQNVEDYHLWMKLLINCIFYSSNHILAKYRVHNNAATYSDKLVLDKIPNVFFNISQLYPECKMQIERELKIRFNSIYKTNLFTKSELAFWIKRNTEYLSKSQISFLYLFLNFLFPTKFTKRVLIYILNA